MSFRCGHAVSQEPILQRNFCGIIPPFCKLDRREPKNVSNYERKGLLRASTFIEIAPGLSLNKLFGDELKLTLFVGYFF